MREDEFVVTPWEVKGKIDYDKLVRQFGTEFIVLELLERIRKHTGDLHFLLRRKIFFSHRDMDWILDKYEGSEKFFLYTGRGPSGHTHLGHLVPWIFCKWLQDKFDIELYFQMADDEKFLEREELTLDETMGFTYDNALDVIALGFDPRKTFIFSDVKNIGNLYGMAIRIAKNLTFSTLRAVFGFTNETNPGMIFFPAIQMAPCFLPSEMKGKNTPCLIPAAIDQDPYWRVARDVAPKFGFYKPAQIHSKFFPSLRGPGSKMSASDLGSAVFTTDMPEVAKEKIMNAFTGQQPTRELQRKLGGNPDVCSICQYYYFLFEEDDRKINEILEGERSGRLLAGEHKADLAERVKRFLIEHQRKREKSKGKLDEFMSRDWI